ncbi:MAG TPA: urate hydroxylase PuuD [Acidimicrobiia bacterium]|nr:urate hydroxylase PuuD [Acidimicrobiia bacterium]
MLDLHLQEWLDIGVRWLHVIVGITWIGTSFYFNWLNNRVRPPADPEPGVAAELWSVHGGGFYRVVKYEVAPERLPETLHWFKWEAYATWLSGFSLLFIVYYLGPSGIAIDPSRVDLTRWALIAIGVGSLAVGWFVYDGLCRTPLARRPAWFALIGLGLAAGAAYGYSQVMTGRAAYIHTGALLGTLMAANVFRVIIPSQRVMVAAMSRGETPDPEPGKDAARRSLHNNYLTLPVVFIMVSNHFPSTFADRWNWAILAAIALAGAGIRHWFNLRGHGERNMWILPAAALVLVALAIITRPPTVEGVPPDVLSIVQQRCVPCHSTTPTEPGYTEAPRGLLLETEGQILARRSAVGPLVESGFMPFENATGMTDEERARVVEWASGG